MVQRLRTWYARSMNTLVVGAAGRTGAHVLRMMLAANIGPVRGMVHRPEHRGGVGAFGADPVLVDVAEIGSEEHAISLAEALTDVDAVICAIRATQPEDADAVDNLGTVRLIRAAEAAGCLRFVLVSSMGTDRPESFPAAMRPFLVAKREAEKALSASSMDWTILRPAGLTDDGGTGRVTLAARLEPGGTVARADVARLAVDALRLGVAERQIIEVVSGDTPIEEALMGLPSSQA